MLQYTVPWSKAENDKLGPDEILDFKYRYRQAIAVSLVQSQLRVCVPGELARELWL